MSSTHYKAVDADNRAKRMAKRPKLFALETNPELRRLVIEKLEKKWSPEQISGWLKVAFIGMPVYFRDPQYPCQRGTDENTNGLIRQYFPKKTDLSIHSQKRLREVANQLNERPRKTLKFKTSAHMIGKSVALIA